MISRRSFLTKGAAAATGVLGIADDAAACLRRRRVPCCPAAPSAQPPRYDYPTEMLNLGGDWTYEMSTNHPWTVRFSANAFGFQTLLSIQLWHRVPTGPWGKQLLDGFDVTTNPSGKTITIPPGPRFYLVAIEWKRPKQHKFSHKVEDHNHHVTYLYFGNPGTVLNPGIPRVSIAMR